MHDLVVVLSDLSSNVEDAPKAVWSCVRFAILAFLVGAAIGVVARQPAAVFVCVVSALSLAFLYHQQDPVWASWLFDALAGIWGILGRLVFG